MERGRLFDEALRRRLGEEGYPRLIEPKRRENSQKLLDQRTPAADPAS